MVAEADDMLKRKNLNLYQRPDEYQNSATYKNPTKNRNTKNSQKFVTKLDTKLQAHEINIVYIMTFRRPRVSAIKPHS